MKAKNLSKTIALVLMFTMVITMFGFIPKVFAEGTVQEEIATAEDGATITLDTNITENLTIPSGKSITIDLNGKNIDVTGDAFSNYGTLVIKGTGNVSATGAAIVNYPNGIVTIDNGSYISTGWYTIKNMGIMTINNMTFKNDVVNGASLVDNGFYGNAASDRGVTDYSKPVKLTINGGSFENKNNSCNVIKNDDAGELIINGGTFTSKSTDTSNANPALQNWNVATINGGTFVSTTGVAVANGHCSDTLDKGLLTINGGTFTSNGYLFGLNGGASKDKGSITINGGTFNGRIDNKVKYTTAKGTYYEFIVKGGVYTDDAIDEIAAEGYIGYRKDGKCYIDEDSGLDYDETVFEYFIQAGDSAELKIVTTEKGNMNYFNRALKEGEDVISLDGLTIKGLKAGTTEIPYNYGHVGGSLFVTVYEITPKDEASEADKETSEILVEAIKEATESEEEVKTLLGVTEEEFKAIGNAIVAGKELTTEVVSEKVEKPTDEDKKLVEEKMTDKQKVAAYYDINVLVKADGEEIAKLRELGKKIKLELAIPEKLPEVPTGCTRTFSVIKIHNGKAEVIAEGVEAKDGKVPCETDSFSTYALTYTDKVATNPKTGDTIMYVAITFVIAMTSVIVVKKIRK